MTDFHAQINSDYYDMWNNVEKKKIIGTGKNKKEYAKISKVSEAFFVPRSTLNRIIDSYKVEKVNLPRIHVEKSEIIEAIASFMAGRN